MALEDILRALDEQADADIADLQRRAASQAEKLGREAQAEAERIVGDAVEAAEKTAQAKADKRLNAARLEARRHAATVRNDAIDAAFALAAEKLRSLRASPEYAAVFRRLLEEAAGVASRREADCVLLVDPANKDLAEQLGAELLPSCAVAAELDAAGGLTIALSSRRVLLINTFENRLERARGIAGSRVAKILMPS